MKTKKRQWNNKIVEFPPFFVQEMFSSKTWSFVALVQLRVRSPLVNAPLPISWHNHSHDAQLMIHRQKSQNYEKWGWQVWIKSKFHEYVEKWNRGLIGMLEASGHTTQGFCREGRRLMQKTCTHRKKCKCKIMNAPSRMSKAGKSCTLQERLKWCVGMGGGL